MVTTHGWDNFEEVHANILPGRKLFRSSAPHYDGHNDSSQNLLDDSVSYLTQLGITRIISLNSVRYDEVMRGRLEAAGIEYLHIPVEDFHPPTVASLLRAIEFYRKAPNAKTLTHCGFGHGRTGTCVTALQLFQSSGSSPVEGDWKKVNHVETDDQMAILRQIRTRYKDEL